MKTLKTSLLAALVAVAGGFTVNHALADGLIIVRPPMDRPRLHPMPFVPPGHFSFAPLAVNYHRVSVEINDLTATTSIDQEFHNPNNARLEGTYVFPLPPGAHIDKFAMDIDGTMTEAELLSADKARALYEDIVRQMKDPALLEYVGRDAFKVRIFPIEPRSNKRIRITYTQLLKDERGLVEYVYPLNTEKFSSTLIKDVSVKVAIHTKTPLKTLYCPTHETEVKRHSDTSAVIGYEAREVRPDSDFKVVFSRTPNPLGVDLICARPPGEKDGHFLLLASPGLTAPAAVQPKDLCFVLDTSGSMAGGKLDQAKKALRFCLANLNPDDRFEVIPFATEAEGRFKSLVKADPANLAKANEAVDALKPIGGTAIGDAIGQALALRQPAETRPYLVIFLTDGLPTVGETREDPLVDLVKKNNSAATRIFPFGIGDDVNTHLLDRIATETKAVSQYVSPKEDLEVKLSNFYSKIKEPVFSNLKLAFTNPDIQITQLQPGNLPDLFNGDMLVVFGRYTGAGPAAVKISGTFNGEAREFVADVSFADAAPHNDYIPQLWATRRVGWLLDEIRLHGESAELIEETTRLARRYGIVTPYTAYLILEDERKRGVPVAQRNMRELERDGVTLGQAQTRMNSLNREARAESSRSGGSATDNAKSMRGLQDQRSATPAAPSVQHELAKAGASSDRNLGYRTAQVQNYATQTRNLNGRAFYQNGNVWSDSTAQAQAALKQVNVRFNSDAYFALLRDHPTATQWLSLGNNLDLVIDDTLYQIRDEGA
jgi:Ca-activated chloride channel family protein